MSYLQNFHHQITGNLQSRKKLVFLHGLMGYGMNWRGISKSFADEFHILYYDQRGHGRSISPKTGYAPEDFASDLVQILDELGWEKIYLVGHSMGGRVAGTFAHLHPKRIEKLVIEDIGPDANPQAIARIEEILNKVPVPFSGKKDAKEYFMNTFLQDFSHRPLAKELGMFLYSNVEEKENGEVFWKFDPDIMHACVLQGRQRERFKEFSEIQSPTLILRGTKTEEFDKDVYERVLAENANFKGIEIEGVGHWIHYESPELFTEKIQEFFAS